MTDIPHAVQPIYEFGNAGDPVVLHRGAMTLNGAQTSGQVELALLPRVAIKWSTDREPKVDVGEVVEVAFQTPTGSAKAAGRCSLLGDELAGSLDPVQIGRENARMSHIVAHWLNLPSINSSDLVRDSRSGRVATDRCMLTIGVWRIAIDQRADHRSALKQATHGATSVLTHVMKIYRDDQSSFTPEDIELLLEVLHVGISFALGRWVAPVLPIGFNKAGEPVWEHWSPLLSTGGQPGSLRWWSPQYPWELEVFLNGLYKTATDPKKRFGLRFVMSSAILAASGGFVEQRIMIAFAALENLAWQRLVVDGPLTSNEYNSKEWKPTAKRLEGLLDIAMIPKEIDRDVLRAMATAYSWLPGNIPRNGPSITTYVRNKIVHPTDPERQLYRDGSGILTESWQLTYDYLILSVLNLVGYQGTYHPNLQPSFEGQTIPVPWAENSG